MNPWVIMLLTGQVGTNVVFYGSYATLAEAMAAVAGTGRPWAYQVVQVFGSGPSYPPGPQPPPTVAPGAWLAVTTGNDVNGNPLYFGYGTFSSQDAANTWVAQSGFPGSFSVGLVTYPF